MAKFEDRLNDKLAVVGEVVTSAAKNNCPVGVYTNGRVGGRLRSSISWKTQKDEGGSSGDDSVSKPDKLSVKIGTNVEYAKFVELGTKRMKRRAYLRLGLYENRNRIKKIMSL